MRLRGFGSLRAPEFPDHLLWLHSLPLTMKALRGKIILVNIFTYSCGNCLRMLPHIKRWHETYQKYGLMVIGVHTPEFVFEKETHNVQRALEDYQVEYPVVLDNDHEIWHSYANRYWPHLFLIDASGTIIYDHVGEGGVSETELAIQRALTENGAPRHLPPLPLGQVEDAGRCYRTTPEQYFGYLRGHVLNIQEQLPDSEEAYNDPGGERREGEIILHGHWQMTAEYVEHTRALAVATEYFTLVYSAFFVNVIAGAKDGNEKILVVTLDGQPVPEAMLGKDCVSHDDGTTTVRVRHYRLYHIIRADHYHHGTLRCAVKERDLQFFSLTFGGCTP